MKSRRPALDLVAAAAAVAAAVVLYLGWRRGLWLHRLLPWASAALGAFGAAHPLPAWVRYALPDALWQYGFAASVLGVWHRESWGARKLAWCSVPLVLGVAVELGQWARLLPGTFDSKDLGLSLLAAALALIVHGRPGPRLSVSDGGRRHDPGRAVSPISPARSRKSTGDWASRA